ncbi:hypothetical protein IFM89_010726 [Coptis chinensis]|uniref:AAA+ ATPase At3g28540-like C-terminal domain-containing protein n=1 Tax=Coptis chinensis TaxID=261450 RepID=A0A835ILR7_9MAGN|nr:hypothetical protein IFM89_010726 [Coptis chinensis]
MDKHIHMSYCTTEGFNQLAFNYLGIRYNNKGKNKLYLEVEELIEESQVTPAEVAEELMKSEEAGIALGELLTFLKRKRTEKDELDEVESPETKRQKIRSVEAKGSARRRSRRVVNRRLGL